MEIVLMLRLPYCFAIVFLACLSASDIKERKISLITIAAFGCAAILFRFLEGGLRADILLFDCLPGFFLFLIGIGTREGIGYGDSIAILVLGLFTGFYICFWVVCIAFLLAGMYALILIITIKIKKAEINILEYTGIKIPFIPFLLAALEVMLLYE